MIENKILLTTSTNPHQLISIFNEKSEIISKITLISVDFSPLEISYFGQDTKTENILGKKQRSEAAIYDVVGVIIDVLPMAYVDNSLKNNVNVAMNQAKQNKKIFVIASDVMYIKKNNQKIVSLNGEFTIIPEELISKVYTNFPELKSVNLEELEDILKVSKDETAVKAFNKLGSYFSAGNYEVNNNIFNIIEHQEQAHAIARKVLLKKMVAWEIRK